MASKNENEEDIRDHLTAYVKMCNVSQKELQKTINKWTTLKAIFQETKKSAVKKGDFIEINVEQRHSPYQFYGSKIDMMLKCAKLQSLLKQNEHKQVILPQRGLICCVSLREENYRAEILKLYKNRTCKVYLIDVGQMELVSWSKLWILNERLFSIEPMVWMFTLSGYPQRLQSNCHELSNDVFDQIKEKNGKFFVFVHGVNNDQCYVRLYVKFDDNSVFYCINDLLVDRSNDFWARFVVNDAVASPADASCQNYDENHSENLKTNADVLEGHRHHITDGNYYYRRGGCSTINRGNIKSTPNANLEIVSDDSINYQNGQVKQKMKRIRRNRRLVEQYDSNNGANVNITDATKKNSCSQSAVSQNSGDLCDKATSQHLEMDSDNASQSCEKNKKPENQNRNSVHIVTETEANVTNKPKDETITQNQQSTRANQPAVTSQQQKIIYSGREFIKLAHVESFSEFYVTFARNEENYRKLHARIQHLMNKVDSDKLINWQIGDNCFVQSKFAGDKLMWHRGTIKEINSSDHTYSVHLRDIGATLIGVKGSEMAEIDSCLALVKNAATKCRMTSIAPLEHENDSRLNINENFKTFVNDFDELAISIQGVDLTESLPVVLWGLEWNYWNALAAATAKWVNINRMVAENHWATITGQIIDYICEKEIDRSDNEDEKLNEFIQYLDSFTLNDSKANDNDFRDISAYDYGDRQYKILDHVEPVYEWLPAEPLEKTILFIEPTYVNRCFVIYALDEYRKWVADEMCKKLTERFNRDICENDDVVHWTVDQPCFARYIDYKFYRAIIRKVNVEKRVCMVSFHNIDLHLYLPQ